MCITQMMVRICVVALTATSRRILTGGHLTCMMVLLGASMVLLEGLTDPLVGSTARLGLSVGLQAVMMDRRVATMARQGISMGLLVDTMDLLEGMRDPLGDLGDHPESGMTVTMNMIKKYLRNKEMSGAPPVLS